MPSLSGSHVRVYAWGLVYLSTCAPKGTPAEELERAADEHHPTGLDHGWKVSADETFSGGEPNPCQCSDDSEREHTLLEC